MTFPPDRHNAALIQRRAERMVDPVSSRRVGAVDRRCVKTVPEPGRESPETEEFRNIADNIPGMVYQRTRNDDGTISFPYVNDGALEVAGFSPAEITLNPDILRNRVHPDDRPEFDEAIHRHFDSKTSHSSDFRYNHPQLGWRWIQTISKPRRRADGSLVAEAVAFDITGRKQTERELEENRQRLNQHIIELQDTKERLEFRSDELIKTIGELAEARDESDTANRVKSDFLATMSHEIRTPMNGVLGMASLLKQTSLTPMQREYLKTIEQSGEALLDIINDVLDYSKMEAGQLELDLTTFSVLEIIDSAVQLIRPNCRKNAVTLRSFVAPEVPDLVVGDSGRLRQILLNLLGNAAKFTTSGSVTLECLEPATVGRDLELRFAVTDTGIGISADAQDRLFEVFSQADASTTRRFGGTGLGLSICRRLCHLMEGEISVESIAEQGSTFRFTVRCGPANGADDQKAPGAPREMRKHALLTSAAIEPDAGLPDQLNAYGIRTEILEDFDAVLERLESTGESVDLVILDAVSVSNDHRVPARLRKFSEREAPVLWIVGPGDPQNFPDRIFLDVPFRQVRLRHHILQLISGNSAPQGADASQPAPVVVASNQQSSLRVLLVEDNTVNQRVAMAMLASAGIDTVLAENGRIAVEIAGQSLFDVILMDIHMPEMDGVTAAQEIRKMPPPHGDIPIIALTANAMKGDREKYLDTGMDDYVSKPIDPAALSDAIRRQAGVSTDFGIAARPAIIPQTPSISKEDTAALFEGLDDILN